MLQSTIKTKTIKVTITWAQGTGSFWTLFNALTSIIEGLGSDPDSDTKVMRKDNLSFLGYRWYATKPENRESVVASWSPFLKENQ